MAPGVRRSEPAGARMVPPREGNEARGDGRRGIGAPHTTGEAGESCPRNPVEGRGRREMDPLAGKTANTPRLEPVSTLRQRIAERARHALGMAWVIFIASWTNGYATARSEAICRGAGCGRTRTSGSVGGQGQQRPWSTRPEFTGAVLTDAGSAQVIATQYESRWHRSSVRLHNAEEQSEVAKTRASPETVARP